MVDFKVVVNDTKKGKSYQIPVTGHHANSLIGKKIGDEVDGIFISLPGYKLHITGGTDKDGFPMKPDLSSATRRRLLLSESKGCHPDEHGKRIKKTVRGNSINQDVVQINMKVTKYSSKPIEQILKSSESKGKAEEKSSEEKKEGKQEEQ